MRYDAGIGKPSVLQTSRELTYAGLDENISWKRMRMFLCADRHATSEKLQSSPFKQSLAHQSGAVSPGPTIPITGLRCDINIATPTKVPFHTPSSDASKGNESIMKMIQNLEAGLAAEQQAGSDFMRKASSGITDNDSPLLSASSIPLPGEVRTELGKLTYAAVLRRDSQKRKRQQERDAGVTDTRFQATWAKGDSMVCVWDAIDEEASQSDRILEKLHVLANNSDMLE